MQEGLRIRWARGGRSQILDLSSTLDPRSSMDLGASILAFLALSGPPPGFPEASGDLRRPRGDVGCRRRRSSSTSSIRGSRFEKWRFEDRGSRFLGALGLLWTSGGLHEGSPGPPGASGDLQGLRDDVADESSSSSLARQSRRGKFRTKRWFCIEFPPGPAHVDLHVIF